MEPVEVVGAYSNKTRTDHKSRDLVLLTPAGRRHSRAKDRQRQNRLSGDKYEQLIAAYREGMSVRDIATAFGINRETVMNHASAAGLAQRYPKLDERAIARAAELYGQGRSLVFIGKVFEVSPETVRKELIKAGIRPRRRRGYE